jgi:hypothetical protein
LLCLAQAGGSVEHRKDAAKSISTLRQGQAKKKRRFYAALRQVFIFREATGFESGPLLRHSKIRGQKKCRPPLEGGTN